MDNLRKDLYHKIFIELPILAKEQGWILKEDHCLARIIYDSVVEAKWSTQVESPFYLKAPLPLVKKALEMSNRLKKEGNSLVKSLNKKSLGYRKQNERI